MAQLFENIFALWLQLFTLLHKTLYSLYTRFIPLLTMLYLDCGNSWHCSIYSFFPLSSVDTNNTNIVARSEPFIFIFYLYRNFIWCSVNWKFSFPRYSYVHCVIHSTHPRVMFALPKWLPRSTSTLVLSWPASCSRACQKIVPGTPRFEDFGFLIHFAHFRNAEIVIWFICLFINL